MAESISNTNSYDFVNEDRVKITVKIVKKRELLLSFLAFIIFIKLYRSFF